MRSIRNMTKAAAVLFLVWSLTVAIGTAAAAEVIIEIPIDTVVIDKNGQPGDIHELETVSVPPEAVGLTCPVVAISGNQESVHPNNDLIAASGSSSVTMFDVEREPLVRTDADGPLTLGDTIMVSLRMGEDLRFSGGFVILIVCQTTVPPTTVPPTTVPPTTVPPTTVPPTTAPPTTAPPTTAPPTTAPTTTAPTSSTSPESTTTSTTQLSTASSTPSGVPTGVGDDGAARVPVAVLTVAALGVTALGVLTYRARRSAGD